MIFKALMRNIDYTGASLFTVESLRETLGGNMMSWGSINEKLNEIKRNKKEEEGEEEGEVEEQNEEQEEGKENSVCDVVLIS